MTLVRFARRLAAAAAMLSTLSACTLSVGPEPTRPALAPTFTPRPAEAAATGRVAGVPDFTCRNPRPPSAGFGYGIQTQWGVGEVAYWNNVIAHKLTLNWVKAQVRWREFEPAPGVYSEALFARLDLWLDDANDRGLNILLSVVDAPAFYRSTADPAHPEQLGPPDDVREAVRFFQLLARRYRGCIQAIEVWNESNLTREWTTAQTLARGGPDAAEFGRFLQVIGPAIEAIDPKILIVAGGLSPTGVNGPGARDDQLYLRELVASGGLSAVDCIGAHLNGFNVPPDKRAVDGFNDPSARFRGPFENPHPSWYFRSTLDAYAQITQMPLCVTEFGWPSMEGLGVAGAPPGFEFALDNSEAEQAAWIVTGFERMHDSGAVRFAIVFNLDYLVKSGQRPDADSAAPYSLLRPGGIPRKAMDAVEALPKRP